jgi:hypothetical protein
LPGYFLAFEVRASIIKAMLATMHRHEKISRAKGKCQNVGGTID